MAPRQQAASRAADERSEQEFRQDVNLAVANTEAEIADFAMDDEEQDNDADTSLEEMGDGLEGDDLIEDDTSETDESEDDQDSQDDTAAGDAEEAGKVEDDRVAARGNDQNGQRQGQQDQARDGQRGAPAIPPGRLRESNERARSAEDRAARLERELAETRGRLDQLATQVNTPRPRQDQQQQEERPDPEPDIFANPQEWRTWNDRQTQKQIKDAVTAAVGGVRQDLQARDEDRINTAFVQARSGPRGYEVDPAYRALMTSLDPRNPRDRAVVQRITSSADPAAALFDWWESNGAKDFRTQMARDLGYEPPDDDGYQDQRPQGRGQQPRRQQQSRNGQQRPRQVYRGPVSLNGAGGGGRQTITDPDALDDSDPAVMRSVWR